MKKILLLLITNYLLFNTLASASDYAPLDTANFEKRKTIAKAYLKKHKDFLKKPGTDIGGFYRTCISGKIKNSKDEFHKSILEGELIFEDEFNQLINSSFEKLKQNNPEINFNPDFYVSRDISLNAFCMIDKTFVINLGAFYFLDNESQMAALLAHELAHTILDHHIKSIRFGCETEVKNAANSVDAIKKSRYGRGSKALENYRNLVYANKKLSRAQEFEADSLGYLLYSKTGQNPGAYLSTFRMMFEFDTIRPVELDTAVYRKVFDLPEQPFKAAWMKMEDFTAYDYSKFTDKFHEDSILDHPQMIERIVKLETSFPELKTSIDSVKPGNLFSKISDLAALERFSSLDLNEEYGFGIFLCLVKMSDDDNSKQEIYRHWLGKYFGKIHKARKDYTLNRYLERVDPKNQPLAYQQFLNFMWNLKVTELETIAQHFQKKSS